MYRSWKWILTCIYQDYNKYVDLGVIYMYDVLHFYSLGPQPSAEFVSHAPK